MRLQTEYARTQNSNRRNCFSYTHKHIHSQSELYRNALRGIVLIPSASRCCYWLSSPLPPSSTSSSSASSHSIWGLQHIHTDETCHVMLEHGLYPRSSSALLRSMSWVGFTYTHAIIITMPAAGYSVDTAGRSDGRTELWRTGCREACARLRNAHA